MDIKLSIFKKTEKKSSEQMNAEIKKALKSWTFKKNPVIKGIKKCGY